MLLKVSSILLKINKLVSDDLIFSNVVLNKESEVTYSRIISLEQSLIQDWHMDYAGKLLLFFISFIKKIESNKSSFYFNQVTLIIILRLQTNMVSLL